MGVPMDCVKAWSVGPIFCLPPLKALFDSYSKEPLVFLSLSGPDYALNDLLFAGVRANMFVPKERIKRITKTEENILLEKRKLRVAAYWRLSTASEEQLVSLAAQKTYY